MALHPFDIQLIKDQVTQYLSSHDLLCLVQVSRLWSDWFIPSLWHSFRIHYRFRELTVLTTPVKTITVLTNRDRAVVVPYYYHHYCHTYGSDEDKDKDEKDEDDEKEDDQDDQDGQLLQKGVLSSSSRRSAAEYTPLTLYKRYIHSLVLYKAIPVIFQEPCPYRFENLQRLQLYNWVQSEEAQGIPPFLRAHPMVQELTLGYMIRDPEQMRALAEMLGSMTGLKRLSLTLTQLEGRRSARRLVQALSRLQEARFVVHDFYEQKEEEEENGKEGEELQGCGSLSSSSSITNLRQLFISVPKALDTSVIFPFLRRCRHLERLEMPLRQSSQEEFGALCNGALFPRLEQLRLHTDAASDDVVTSILADENHREPPEGGTEPWRGGGGGGGGLRLEALKISTTKREHIYPGSFWALAQFHGQTLTSLELEGLERMALLDYNVLLGRLVKLRHLKITISLWPPKHQPETSYGSGSLTTTRMLNGRSKYDSEPWKWLGPTWGCIHLQTLHLTVRHVPSDGRSPSPPGQFEHVTVQCMEESYLNIIGQIGKLRELRELVLQGPLNPLRLKAVDPTVRNEEDTICRRLSMLSGLCELRALDIEHLRGKLIGIEEVVWMLDHWPRLVQLKGLENLSTKDVVAWLHARRPWMDIGRK